METETVEVSAGIYGDWQTNALFQFSAPTMGKSREVTFLLLEMPATLPPVSACVEWGQYVYRYRGDYSAVLWLQADSHEIFSLACVQLAQELGLPERNEADQARIVAAVKRWLKSKKQWLLVLDSVEDLTMIEEFLPSGYHGCVLLTTRARAVSEHIALVHELEVLPEEDGVLLLLRRARLLVLDAPLEQADPADCAQAKELWELVGQLVIGLP